MAHNAAMNMGRLREGRPLPGPPPLGEGTGRLPAGRGLGKPGFPVCSPQTVMRRAHNARMKIVLFLGGRSPPKPSPLAGCFLGGLRPPTPSRARAMFTSESATPRAFVYSFPIRWPISPRRPRKPIAEQVKPVEGLCPPKPSRGRATFSQPCPSCRTIAVVLRAGMRADFKEV